MKTYRGLILQPNGGMLSLIMQNAVILVSQKGLLCLSPGNPGDQLLHFNPEAALTCSGNNSLVHAVFITPLCSIGAVSWLHAY